MRHNPTHADSVAALAFVAARVLINIPGSIDNGGISAAAPPEDDALDDGADATRQTDRDKHK